MIMEGYEFRKATSEDLEMINQFALDNIQTEWQFCGGMPPVPGVELMQLNLDLGNPFALGFKDGVLMGYHIASRRDGAPLWGVAHKDLDGEELLEAHANITALIWKQLGRAMRVPVPGESYENVANELNSTLDLAYEIYERGGP